MPLPTLLLPPDQQGYQFIQRQMSISTELDGGASRFRADLLGAAFEVDVQWTLSKKNFEYLTAFFRTSISYGADPFIIGLMLEDGSVQNYTVHFMPRTFKLTQQMGETYVVTAKLEAVPDDTYTTGDAAIIAAGPDV